MRPRIGLLFLIPLLTLPQDTEKLVDLLRSESIVERDEATGTLRTLGTAAVPTLQEAVDGGDTEAATRADMLIRWIRFSERLSPMFKHRFTNIVDRLTISDSPAWTDFLREAARLQDARRSELDAPAGAQTPGEKKDVIGRIWASKLHPAVPSLHRLLEDPSPSVVMASLEALGILPAADVATFLDRESTPRPGVATCVSSPVPGRIRAAPGGRPAGSDTRRIFSPPRIA